MNFCSNLFAKQRGNDFTQYEIFSVLIYLYLSKELICHLVDLMVEKMIHNVMIMKENSLLSIKNNVIFHYTIYI